VTQVSVVAFKKGSLEVKSHAWDRSLGGRDFDEALFDHYCTEFKAKFKIDVKTNAKAAFKLRTAAEKVSWCFKQLVFVS
jgi:heat shock 70kDa protein 4